MTLGLDHAARPGDYPAFCRAAVDAGYRFEFRYLCTLNNPAHDADRQRLNAMKIARPGEVQVSLDAGLEEVLIWQDAKRDAAGGRDGGRTHAAEARRQAEALGYPAGCVIYFAVGDYDAPDSDLDLIASYLIGARERIGPYQVGGYGKRSVVEEMLRRHLIVKAWQSYGFSRPIGEISRAAAVYQRREQTTVAGITCDVNEAFAELGGWKHMQVWHPRARRVTPNPYIDGGSWVDGYAWRQLVHTTEGGPAYRPSTSSYFGHSSWPHATVGRVDGVATLVQHLPIDRAARATKNAPGGVETNRALAVQIEICWWAGRITELPDDIADVAADWLRWVAEQTGAPLDGPTFYGPDAGWALAAPTARQRFSFDAWRRFTGVCGHQHVPENDHWDPGALDLDRLITAPTPSPKDDLLMPAALSDDDARRCLIRQWFWLHLGRGFKPGTFPDGTKFTAVQEQGLHLWIFQTKGADVCLAGIVDSTEAQARRKQAA